MLTYNDRADKGVVKDPSRSHVGYAYSAVFVTNVTEHSKERLEKRPVTPRFDDHIKVLDVRSIGSNNEPI